MGYQGIYEVFFFLQVTGSMYPEIFRGPKTRGSAAEIFLKFLEFRASAEKISWNKNNSNPG